MITILEARISKTIVKILLLTIFIVTYLVLASIFLKSLVLAAPSAVGPYLSSPNSTLNYSYGAIVKGYSAPPSYNDTDLVIGWNSSVNCTASGDWSGTKAAGVNMRETRTVGPRVAPQLFTYNMNCGGTNYTTYGAYIIPEVRFSGDLDGVIAGLRNFRLSGFTQVTAAPYSFRFTVDSDDYTNFACGNASGRFGLEVFLDGTRINFTEDGAGLPYTKHLIDDYIEHIGRTKTLLTESLPLTVGAHTLEVRMGIAERNVGAFFEPSLGRVINPFADRGYTREYVMGQFAGSPNSVIKRDVDNRSFFWATPTIGSDKLKATINFNIAPPANNLSVQSSGVAGVSITGSQAGTSSPVGGTPYTVTMSSNINTVLTAPPTWGGRNFNGWSSTCDSRDFTNRTCTVTVSGGGTKTVTVDYILPPNNRLWVYSSPGGIPITGSQSGTGGVTATSAPQRYTVSQPANINTVLTAPPKNPSNTHTFSNWSGQCDTKDDTARTCTVAVTGGALKIVTANYVQDRPNLTVLSQTNPQVEWIFTPQKIVANIPMTITATIQNNGTANISSTSTFFNSLRVVSGGGFNPSPIPNTSWTSGLNAGLSQQFTWSGTPTSSNTYTFEVCADSTSLITESDESLADNCERASVEVDSAKAWLKTVGGNVGSATNQLGIDSISGWSPSGCSSAAPNFCNSTHLIVAARGIQNTFKSAKNWLLPTYTGGPNLGTYRNYESFHRDFSAGVCDRSTDSSKLPNTKGKFIYKGPGTVSFTSYDTNPCGAFVSSNKDAILIFIEGDLQISASMPAVNLPTVFIVKGNISIAGGVTNIGGMFVADGNFTTGSSDEQLRINGSVAAALNTSGLLTFGRDLEDDDNEDTPAELITFNPKYLYFLTDFLGNSASSYREDNP